jgi:hypothetical protein
VGVAHATGSSQIPSVEPAKGGLLVRYITHEFAHPETLERARRWLIQAGFDASRIEAFAGGIPRLAVAVEMGETAEAALLIDAAEAGDPDGFPSFWEHHHQPRVSVPGEIDFGAAQAVAQSGTFVIGWQPVDRNLEVTQASTEVSLQLAFQQQWE